MKLLRYIANQPAPEGDSLRSTQSSLDVVEQPQAGEADRAAVPRVIIEPELGEVTSVTADVDDDQATPWYKNTYIVLTAIALILTCTLGIIFFCSQTAAAAHAAKIQAAAATHASELAAAATKIQANFRGHETRAVAGALEHILGELEAPAPQQGSTGGGTADLGELERRQAAAGVIQRAMVARHERVTAATQRREREVAGVLEGILGEVAALTSSTRRRGIPRQQLDSPRPATDSHGHPTLVTPSLVPSDCSETDTDSEATTPHSPEAGWHFRTSSEEDGAGPPVLLRQRSCPVTTKEKEFVVHDVEQNEDYSAGEVHSHTPRESMTSEADTVRESSFSSVEREEALQDWADTASNAASNVSTPSADDDGALTDLAKRNGECSACNKEWSAVSGRWKRCGCKTCQQCNKPFSQFSRFTRQHHCRKCDKAICKECMATRPIEDGRQKRARLCPGCTPSSSTL